MLLEFAIDIEAIDGSTDRSVINRLLDTWRNYGVLVSPEKNAPSLRARFQALKRQYLRKMWQETWKHVMKNQRNAYRSVPLESVEIPWNSITTPTDLEKYEFDMALLKESRAKALKIERGIPQLYGNVEGAIIHDADQTNKVQTSKSLSKGEIERGIPTEDLWTERFKRFAKTSHEISIVDKYAFREGTI